MNSEKLNRTQGPKKPKLIQNQRFPEGFRDFRKKTSKPWANIKIESRTYKMMYIVLVYTFTRHGADQGHDANYSSIAGAGVGGMPRTRFNGEAAKRPNLLTFGGFGHWEGATNKIFFSSPIPVLDQ